MQRSLENTRESVGAHSLDRSNRIVDRLSGTACRLCGARHYYLVFRVIKGGRGATLAARCSRCHEKRDSFSLEQLARDIGEAPAGQVLPNAPGPGPHVTTHN